MKVLEDLPNNTIDFTKIKKDVTELLWQALLEASKLSKSDQNKLAKFIKEKIETSINRPSINVPQATPQNITPLTNQSELVFKQSGADFLLSIAGTVNTGANNTSEHVKEVVGDFILAKHGNK